MPRLETYAALGLTSLILLAGCGKSTTPATMGRDNARDEPSVVCRLEPRLLSADLVVAASHAAANGSRQTFASDNVNAPPVRAAQHIWRRLPPVAPAPEYPHTASPDAVDQNVAYPDTGDFGTGDFGTGDFGTGDFGTGAEKFERLPAVEGQPTSSDRAAVTLPQRRPMVSVGFLPAFATPQQPRRSEQMPPRRRFMAPQLPKPQLPPTTTDANTRVRSASPTRDTAAALATVSDRVDTMTGRAFVLAEKGALYSAKAEFHQALRAVAQSLDAQSGSKDCSMAMALGLQALEEADDFATYAQHGPFVNVELIVDAHQTPLLKPYDLSDVPPVVAMQRYYTFAQEQLVTACGGAAVASRVFYGLGKLHMVLGEEDATAERLHGPKAMAFHQTALIVDPMNHLAANELGVLLARFGKFPEARSVLQHAVAIRPLAETWQNLSVVHRELEEMELAAQAEANWQYVVQQSQQRAGTQPQGEEESMVQWVPPQQFMGMPDGQPGPARAPRIQEVQPVQAKQKTGFLWW